MRMPLVSIVIPAYNAEELIPYTLQSAMAQTWSRKEIIVCNDGSTDRTAEVARRFKGVKVLTTANGGLSAAVNNAYRASQGDYIQYLDSDDLLAPDKVKRQLAALRDGDSKRLLLSSPWAPFFYRTRHSRFVQNALCQDLSPVDWLLRKLGDTKYTQNHMQNATWLVSRELAEAAGPWNESLQYDQDGEFFTRVLVASEGVRFVPGTGIFYRATGTGSVSYIGASDKKKESFLVSIKLHIKYLRSLEESERVRNACLTYLQRYLIVFYPERPDLVAEMQALAAEIGKSLEEPCLRPKYAWMKRACGFEAAKWAQVNLPAVKSSWFRRWDKAMFSLESGRTGAEPVPLFCVTSPGRFCGVWARRKT